MLGRHGSIVMPVNTPYAAEMRKHEAQHTEFGKGERPYVFREFPKRIYRAVRRTEGPGIDYEGFTVQTPEEQQNMLSRGYFPSQADALRALEREQLEHGKLAAEREYEIAHGRLSARAIAEVRAAETAHGATHLPMVPETPIKRRGRPATVTVPAE